MLARFTRFGDDGEVAEVGESEVFAEVVDFG